MEEIISNLTILRIVKQSQTRQAKEREKARKRETRRENWRKQIRRIEEWFSTDRFS